MNKEKICLTTAQFAKLHNVNKRTLHYYDKIGLFSPWWIIYTKPKQKYEKMLQYAEENHLQLTGYAYEKGLNDFAICNENEYVTQILIKIKE